MSTSAPAISADPFSWRAALHASGFAFVPAAAVLAALAGTGAALPADWIAFTDSWARLQPDTYMADHGRYRRRRHAVFAVSGAGQFERLPHQAHWQGLDYNPLNGGVERWFAAVEDRIAEGVALQRVLALAHSLFQPLSPQVGAWKVEVHQFRIEATADMAGLPTPEGVHRDGVDWVLVLLIHRHNIAAGTTTIHGQRQESGSVAEGSAPGPTPLSEASREVLGEFTLTTPGDVALVDDQRCFHGVTAVHPLDPTQPAFRDVLVLTFRANT